MFAEERARRSTTRAAKGVLASDELRQEQDQAARRRRKRRAGRPRRGIGMWEEQGRLLRRPALCSAFPHLAHPLPAEMSASLAVTLASDPMTSLPLRPCRRKIPGPRTVLKRLRPGYHRQDNVRRPRGTTAHETSRDRVIKDNPV